jgi:hypothetical protein
MKFIWGMGRGCVEGCRGRETRDRE